MEWLLAAKWRGEVPSSSTAEVAREGEERRSSDTNLWGGNEGGVGGGNVVPV